MKWIEVYRTLGIMVVVVMHTTELSLVTPGKSPTWLVACFSVFRMVIPGFLIISGFLLRRGDVEKNREFQFGTFWRSKFTTIVIPFIAWNIIYMFMFFFIEHQPIRTWNTLFQVTTGYMHLYFVFVLIQLFLVYSLIHRWLSRRNMNYFLAAAAVGSILFYLVSEITLRMGGADNHFFEWHYGKFFIAWGLFFFWGMWLADHFDFFEKLTGKIWPLAIASALSYAFYVWQMLHEVQVYGQDSRQYFQLGGLLFQFVAASFVLALLYRIDQRGISGKFAEYLVTSGRDSYGIYLSHLLFLSCLVALWSALGLPQILWLEIVLVAPLTWIIAQLIVRGFRTPRLSRADAILFGRGR